MKPQLACVILIVAGCAANKTTTIAVVPTSTASTAPTTQPTPRSKPKATPVPRTIGEVRAVEFSLDRRYLAVGTRRGTTAIDGIITVRDCATNRVVKSWRLSGGAKFLAFSSDGKWLASTGADSDVRVWDWKNGRIIHRQNLDTGSGGSDRQSLAFSPNGRFLAVGVDGVKLLNTKHWKSRHLHLLRTSGPYGVVGSVGFSPGGIFLLTSDNFEGDDGYNLIPLSGGKTRNIPNELAWSAPVFSEDGRFMAGSGDGSNGLHSACVWNVRTLKREQVFRSEQFQPHAFSPHNRFVVGLSIDYNNTRVDEGPVEIWSVATGKRVRRFKETARRVVWLNPRTLLLGDEKRVRRLSLPSLRQEKARP